jgi:hypothetical protein
MNVSPTLNRIARFANYSVVLPGLKNSESRSVHTMARRAIGGSGRELLLGQRRVGTLCRDVLTGGFASDLAALLMQRSVPAGEHVGSKLTASIFDDLLSQDSVSGDSWSDL